jgi:hypothetical protein
VFTWNVGTPAFTSSHGRPTPVPRCPIRAGDPCSLCVPGATGPQDCGVVWLVRSDPELLDELASARAELRG